MIEPYFAVWLETRDAWLKEDSLDSFRESWKNTNGIERFAISLFMIYSAILLLSSIVVAFDQALLPVYGLGYAVFFLLYAMVQRVLIGRDRRIPQRKLEVRAELIENLRTGFKGIGLIGCEQMQIVKDEAVRLLERKEHLHEAIIHTAIELCILTALVLMLNFVMTMLEYDLPLETAGVLAVIAIVLAVSAVILVHAVWTVYDRFGRFPTPRLRLFVSDLDDLLVDGFRDPSPSRAVNHRRRLVRSLLP